MNTQFFKIAPVAALVVSAVISESTAAKNEANQSLITDSSVMIVTAPVDSPLTITTSPKTPRQPVPASDGSDYLKLSLVFRKFVMVGQMATLFFAGCLARVYVF